MDSVDISICIYVCIWHFTYNLATQYLPYDLVISFFLLSGMQASLIVYEIWNSILTKRPLYILIQMCVFFLWIQSETPTPDENEYQVWGFQVYSILYSIPWVTTDLWVVILCFKWDMVCVFHLVCARVPRILCVKCFHLVEVQIILLSSSAFRFKWVISNSELNV